MTTTPRTHASKTATPEKLTPLLYTRPQAAAKLAISQRNFDEQCALGNIPVVKIGKSSRFRPSALEYFIEANETRHNPKRRAAIRAARK